MRLKPTLVAVLLLAAIVLLADPVNARTCPWISVWLHPCLPP